MTNILEKINTEDLIKVETYCPCFTGFYGTSLGEIDIEEDYVFDNAYKVNSNILSKVMDIIQNKTDYTKLQEGISQQVVDYFNILFEQDNKEIVFTYQSLSSPRYYNYSNDSINIEITSTKQFLKELEEYINTNINKFSSYIKERYTSYDGFSSFYSNDYKEWLTYLNKETLESNEHYLGTFLEFYFAEEYNDISEDMYDYCHEQCIGNGFAFECVDWEAVRKELNEFYDIEIDSEEKMGNFSKALENFCDNFYNKLDIELISKEVESIDFKAYEQELKDIINNANSGIYDYDNNDFVGNYFLKLQDKLFLIVNKIEYPDKQELRSLLKEYVDMLR